MPMSYPLNNADLLKICGRHGTATGVLGLVNRGGGVQTEVGLLG